MQIGWRNVAKRIAYGPTLPASGQALTETVVPSNGNGRKRNGHKPFTVAWYDKGQLRYGIFYGDKDASAFSKAWPLVHENDTTRFQREIPWPFTPARPAERRFLDATNERLALYPVRECCGSPMGVMERWDQVTDQVIRGLYQCAVNPAHHEEAYAISGAAVISKQPRR
jgi:hypothetical protein